MSGWGESPLYAPFWKRVVAFVATRIGTILVLAGLVVLVGQIGYCVAQNAETRAAKAEAAAAKARVAQVVRDLEGVQGVLIKERQAKLSPKLSEFAAAVKKADPNARLDSVSSTTITITDTDQGTTTTAPGAACPDSVQDSHHRFRFDLPSGLLHREQKFKFDAVTLRDRDGSYRVHKMEFREFDPKTGEEIPSKGVEYEGTFEFVEIKPVGPGPWHLRGVAAAAYPLGFGAGVQVNPYKNLTLGPVVLYQPSTASSPAAVVGALGVGWRLFGSTISVGPYAGISSRGGAFVGGALATIEVTR